VALVAFLGPLWRAVWVVPTLKVSFGVFFALCNIQKTTLSKKFLLLFIGV